MAAMRNSDVGLPPLQYMNEGQHQEFEQDRSKTRVASETKRTCFCTALTDLQPNSLPGLAPKADVLDDTMQADLRIPETGKIVLRTPALPDVLGSRTARSS